LSIIPLVNTRKYAKNIFPAPQKEIMPKYVVPL